MDWFMESKCFFLGESPALCAIHHAKSPATLSGHSQIRPSQCVLGRASIGKNGEGISAWLIARHIFRSTSLFCSLLFVFLLLTQSEASAARAGPRGQQHELEEHEHYGGPVQSLCTFRRFGSLSPSNAGMRSRIRFSGKFESWFGGS